LNNKANKCVDKERHEMAVRAEAAKEV